MTVLHGTLISNYHSINFITNSSLYGVYNGNGKTIPGNSGSYLVQFEFGIVDGNIIRYTTYNIDYLTKEFYPVKLLG